MKIHWYWPYSHAGNESPFVRATLRPEDTVTVQSLATRFGEAVQSSASYEVVQDLREANGSAAPATLMGRSISRSRIYRQRARARQHLVESRDFDVTVQFHVNYLVDHRALKKLSNRLPVVSFVHDVEPHQRRLPAPLESALLRRTHGAAGELVVYHDALRDRLVADHGVQAERVHVIPVPLEVQHVSPRPEGPCRFLFFGTFRHNKGVPDLLAAVRQLGMDGSWELRLAGRGDAAVEAEVMSVAHDQPAASFEIGFVSPQRKAELFQWADVIVLPYRSFASQSGVLADAYAFGRPLIVTDVGALGRTVRADGTGAVVSPGKPSELAAAMATVVQDPELWRSRTDAVRRAAQKHRFERVGPQLREVLDVAVDRWAR